MLLFKIEGINDKKEGKKEVKSGSKGSYICTSLLW